jgi:hypothetical protein
MGISRDSDVLILLALIRSLLSLTVTKWLQSPEHYICASQHIILLFQESTFRLADRFKITINVSNNLCMLKFAKYANFGTLYVIKAVFGRDIGGLSMILITHFFISVNPYP